MAHSGIDSLSRGGTSFFTTEGPLLVSVVCVSIVVVFACLRVWTK